MVSPLNYTPYQMQGDLDFSSLAKLPQVYQQARERESLAALGRGLADGTIDYRKAAGAAADMGNIDATLRFLALDEAQKKQARQDKASDDFTRALGGGASTPSAAPSSPKVAPASNRIYAADEMNPQDAAVATPRELAAGVPAYVPEQYRAVMGKAAIDSDLPVEILARQTRQESGFNPAAVSSAGAQGISQFMPATARDMGINPNDPQQAIPAQAAYLRQNVDKFGGSLPLGLAAYNYGPGNVERVGGDISRMPAETRDYVRNITSQQPYQVAQAGPGASAAPSGAARPAEIPTPVLLQAINNKDLPEAQREVAKELWKRRLDEMKPADRIKVLQGLKDNPELLDIEKQLKAAGKTDITIDNRAENEEAKAAGKAAGERRAAMFASAGSAAKTLGNLSRVEALLDQVNQGKLEPTRMSISAWAKSFGLPDGAAEQLGLDPKAVGSAQALQALTSEMVVGKIGSGGFPANNFSDADRAFLVGTMPQLANDPRGNKIIVQAGKRVAQLDIDRAKAWQEFRKDPANKGKGFEDFELEFSEKVASKDMFGDLRKEAEAIVGQPRAQQQAAPQGDFEEPRAAADGKKYIRRNGQYFRVVD